MDDGEYDELYRDAKYAATKAVRDALNTHILLLATEHNVVVQPHKYPCMTISLLVKAIANKYKGGSDDSH